MAPRRTRGARIESRTPPQYAMRTERGAGRAMERMETAPTYLLIINHGRERGYETRELERDDFIAHTSRLLKRPRKVFLGLGDFLEVGDYKKLIDSLFFNISGSAIETLLDDSNRQVSAEENIPFSFFKLAVYFPDFILRDIPTSCASVIGKKGRLFPGAENFIKHIKPYDPLILTAIPHEIAIEFVKRLDLEERNLISTRYAVATNAKNREVYSGGVRVFMSGNRRSIEIEKVMNRENLSGEDIVYIGRGEAGFNAFANMNSMAFNPTKSIIPESTITLYGSSLESLLVLFNFGGAITPLLTADAMEANLPSLVVFSEERSKRDELIELELSHRHLQNNIIGQRLEHSGESYVSVEREIDIEFGGSSIDIQGVRDMVKNRMSAYRDHPQDFVHEVTNIARERSGRLYSSPEDES